MIALAARLLPWRRRKPADSERTDRDPGVAKRLGLAVPAAILAAIAVGFVSQKLGLAETRDTTVLPPMPAAPHGSVEYRGTTSDGMEMGLWRRARSVLIRVDSAESACGIGKNFVERLIESGRRSRFADRWTYHTTAVFSQPRLGGLLPPSEQVLEKRVDAEVYGRFLPDGRAAGRFTRRDVIHDDRESVVDCTRGVSWTARSG